MQDTLLRVFVLALGLLTYPRDDSGVKEWDDITTEGMQKQGEWLLRGGEKLDHEMVHVSEEMTHTNNRGPGDDLKTIQSDQHVAENDKMSVLEDVTVTIHDSEEDIADHNSPEGGYFIGKTNPSWQQKTKSEPETVLKTSQIDHEPNGKKQLYMRSKQGADIQTDGPYKDSSTPQEQEKSEEKEVFIYKEQEPPVSHLHTGTSENETSEAWEEDYLWYICSTLSIVSMIRFFRKYLGRNSQMKQKTTRAFPVNCTADDVLLPDSDTLQQFHAKCIQASSEKKWKGFLEGFANDLLEAMRTVCDRNSGMVIDDFQMEGACNIVVPFTPPDPYSFQSLLTSNQASDLLPDMQVCGQIKLVENKNIQNGCHCQSPNSDDMLCLLHCESGKGQAKINVYDCLLCTKNSFLSKSQVTRWFQNTMKQAWEQISHKYEFELNIRYIGTLVVRFRSGKKISFSMNPVVKVDTDAHFLITPGSSNNLDTFWTLSLTKYEDRFLELISKRLPVNSCHSQTFEIVRFLHKRQTALSGRCALKDFHFKTALMHLLLTKHPSQWKPTHVTDRLQDLLAFLERSLEKKLLHHVLIGNPLKQRVIQIPDEVTHAKTVNLFHPLVVHNCMYRNTVMHFQEMLSNAHMLITDYVDQR